MKTTLTIDDHVMARLRAEARRRKRSVSALVEQALRAWLREPKARAMLTKLPTFKGGRFLADVSNRGELHDAMEDR